MESLNWVVRNLKDLWGFLAEKENRGYVVGGSLYSVANIPRVYMGFDLSGLVAIWSVVGGIVYPVITAVLIKITLRLLVKKIFPKIKFLKDVDDKEDDSEKAA